MPASSGVSSIRTQFGEPLVVLLGATGLVLLIACANLANLLLARASAREKEMAVRLAIGAARRRLVAQLLVESVLLALIGTVLGIIVARGLTTILIAQIASGFGNIFIDLTWNSQMFAFTAGVSVLACLLFGLMPALKATAVSPANTLRAGARGLTMSRERFGLRRLLVVTQVALSLVLLLGALLFSRTLYNLLSIDTGFDQKVLVVDLNHRSLAGDVDRGRAMREDIVERLAAIPGDRPDRAGGLRATRRQLLERDGDDRHAGGAGREGADQLHARRQGLFRNHAGADPARPRLRCP